MRGITPLGFSVGLTLLGWLFQVFPVPPGVNPFPQFVVPVALYSGAASLLWLAVARSVTTSTRPVWKQKGVRSVGLLVSGIVGAAAFVVIWRVWGPQGQPSSMVKTRKDVVMSSDSKGTGDGTDQLKQHTEGMNSPTISGNNNTVTINPHPGNR